MMTKRQMGQPTNVPFIGFMQMMDIVVLRKQRPTYLLLAIMTSHIGHADHCFQNAVSQRNGIHAEECPTFIDKHQMLISYGAWNVLIHINLQYQINGTVFGIRQFFTVPISRNSHTVKWGLDTCKNTISNKIY